MAAMTRVAAFTALWRALRAARRPGAPGIGAHLAAVPRMLAWGLTGRYPGLGKGRLLVALLGALYLVSPLDVVPELLFGVFGLGDDALVAAWVAGAVLSEADAFLGWETQRRRVVAGEVVP